MTTLLSPTLGFLYLGIFGALMIAITFFFGRRVGTKSLDGFLVANRQIPWWLGGTSVAASWTWAVALMISVQQAYEHGFAGIFWFTVPNIAAVLVFMWLGPKIRGHLPAGYSLPEWMHHRFSSIQITYLYLFVYFYYQVMAAAVQIYAGGSLLATATGIDVKVMMPLVLLIPLVYALISGLEASVVTDFIQLALMLGVGWMTVAMVLEASGGAMSFSGVLASGSANPLVLSVVLTAGIIQTIGLMSGSIGDQQFWQRCFGIRKGDVRKSFLFAAVLFASIPIGLGLLGFTGASPSVGLELAEGFDRSLVGFVIVKDLLPAGIATLFLFVLLAGLTSTLDSALSASSSLYALVQAKPWRKAEKRREGTIGQSRGAMVGIGVLGLAIGYLVVLTPTFDLKYLWWFLNTIGASVVVPTVLSLYSKRLTARGVLLGSGSGLLVGLPMFVYGSMAGNDYILAATYVVIIGLSLLFCLALRSKEGV